MEWAGATIKVWIAARFLQFPFEERANEASGTCSAHEARDGELAVGEGAVDDAPTSHCYLASAMTENEFDLVVDFLDGAGGGRILVLFGAGPGIE